MNDRIEFEYHGWHCWRNLFGYWGATLSRKGLQLQVIDEQPSRAELIKAINEA